MDDKNVNMWFIKGVKIRMIKESCDRFKAWRWAISRRVYELDSYILKNEKLLEGEA